MDKSNKEKILVTGGLGYIGSHTVVELLKEGYEVLIIDNLSNSNIKILEQIEKITKLKPIFFNIDLCDAVLLKRIVDENPDLKNVIHFAAHKAVGESVADPLKYYENNLYSLVNILKAFSNRNLNIVFSSSCTVYGNPAVLPVTEDSPVQKAESPYGNTKKICEEVLFDVSQSNEKIKVISLRYFNPVGAHESVQIGELPVGSPQNLVPYIAQSAMGLRGPITVYGADYDTPDGSAVRDYIHVSDLARAHLCALYRLEKAGSVKNFEVYNIGTGEGTSVLEVIKTFEKVNNLRLDYSIGERRKGDVEKIWADVTLAKEKLNFKTEKSLEDMMRSAWEWQKYLAEHPF